MAYTPDDPVALETATVATFGNRFAGADTSPESFLGKLGRAIAQALWNYETALQRVSLDTVPNTRSSYARLADWATALGLSNGAGGYGPLVATAATGLTGTATGSNGSTIPIGAQLVAADGLTTFQVTANATIAGGVAAIAFDAITAGAAGNLTLPATVTFTSPPAGVAASVTLTAGATNGSDAESLSALLTRILVRLQSPPKAGTAGDYKVWAETTAGAGVDRCYVYPRRGGTGTVDLVMTQAATTGAQRPLPAPSIALVQANVENLRPVTVERVRYLAPTHDATKDLTVRVRVKPTLAKNAFTWNDTAGYTVAGYSAGPPATLTVSAAPPTMAVGATLIVAATGGPEVPGVATVTAWNAGTKVATLALPTNWVSPTNGDAIYAASPMTTAIATAVQAYINGLGPSLVGGYGDAVLAPWNDTTAYLQIARIALDVTDANGVRYAANLIADPTIAVGVGALSAQDFEPADTVTAPPSYAVIKVVLVTQ